MGRGKFIAPDVVIGAGVVVSDDGGPVRVESACRLGDYVSIRGGVRLGPGSRVGSYVLLGHLSKEATQGQDAARSSPRVGDLLVSGAETVIEDGAIIRSHSVIYKHVRAGDHLTTGHNTLIREHTRIGQRCVFGSYASCDGYTSIGDDVHVGQYVQLSQAARIGNGAFLGGHTVFSDNLMAVRSQAEDLFGAVVEEYARVGLSCIVLPNVRVGRDSFIGAGSVVTADIPPGVVAFGNPCRIIRDLSPHEIETYRASVSLRPGQAPPRP